jgi:phage protein D
MPIRWPGAALSFSNAAVRAPRLVILANGTPLAGVIEAEVTSHNHDAADRFCARLALDADPMAAQFWAGAADILADIRFSLDAGAGQSLMQGTVDHVEIDPIARLVSIEGRDLTARLIETRTQESFANRTASEIATILAARHGLTPEVTATTTPVGRYYQDQHDRIVLDQFSRALTEWDLLVWLANQEGFRVFVRGTTLYFQPEATSPRVLPITPADVQDMRLGRALNLARTIEVTVKSWNSRQQDAFTQTARSGGGSDTGVPQRIVLVRPNLSMDQALKLAQSTLAKLTRHRMVLNLTMPGELLLTPGDALALSGTASGLDQLYFVDSIHRRLSARHGFVQYVCARNDDLPAQAGTPAAVVGSVTG